MLDSFTEVESSGSNEVNITYGATQRVEVLVDDNVISCVRTSVYNSKLSIDMDDDIYYKNVSLTVNITIPYLTYIKNSGSGEFYASGFEGINSMTIKNSGSGQIKLNGSCNDLTIKNSGSGEVNAFTFKTKNCDIKNSRSGVFEVFCSDNLTGKNSGSGTIYYKGYPSIYTTNSGSGSIINSN